MSGIEYEKRPASGHNLPALVHPAQHRSTLSRYDLPSNFVSHLIATRDQMGHQRAKRRAPANQALNAYEKGEQITARRMPAGYRLAMSA